MAKPADVSTDSPALDAERPPKVNVSPGVAGVANWADELRDLVANVDGGGESLLGDAAIDLVESACGGLVLATFKFVAHMARHIVSRVLEREQQRRRGDAVPARVRTLR